MKGDRKLRLVSPAGDGPTPPKTVGQSREDSDLGAALRAAYGAGAPLPEEIHEELLAKALGSAALDLPEAPATPDEEKAAAELRAALEPGAHAHRAGDRLADAETAELVSLARALSAAYRPQPLDDLRSQAIWNRALGRDRRKRRVTTVSGILFATAAAAAAVFGLQIQNARSPASGELEAVAISSSASLAVSRSTQGLFDAAVPFERSGGTSERVDRIARSRAGELRANRFARWGIQ
jgi:hypothetical protein